ncbi:hypothetical protein ACJZ2D_016063 [Fusarium nematophilum]
MPIPAVIAFIGTGLAMLLAPVTAASIFLSLLGFKVGVMAGSVAAFIHSMIGNVAAGSIFAVFQSAGAGGAGMGIIASAMGYFGAVFTAIGVLWAYFL